MNKKLVSVIIPTYNRPFKMLERAIISVKNQTYKHIEIIVVDDNGDKNRLELDVENNIGKYHDVIYIKNKTNLGPSESRNIGIANSNGFYISFLDDDDEYENTKIEKQIIEMNNSADSNIGLINIGYKVVDANKSVKRVVYPPKIKGNGLQHLLCYGNYIIYPLIKKECFAKVGDFNSNYYHSEDFEMWIRILKEYSVSYVYEPLACYYFHNNDKLTFNYNDFVKASIEIEKTHKDVYLCNKDAKWNMYRSRSKAYAHLKDLKLAFITYYKCIRFKPYKIINNITTFLHIIYIIIQN